MSIEILMPALSPTMEEGTLAKWLVKEGDKVSSGDVIAEIETDKAVMEFEAVDEGVIGRILVAEGVEDVKVNTPIAILLEEGERATDIVDAVKKSAPTATAQAAPQAAAPAAASVPVRATDDAARVFATPLARRLAKEQGLDLGSVQGSGPHGRIVQDDIVRAKQAPAASAPKSAPSSMSMDVIAKIYADRAYTEIPLDNMRKTIAARLTEAKQSIPHFYLRREITLDRLLSLRSEMNKGLEARAIKLSVNDFIIKASAMALQSVPDCNAVWAGDRILRLTPSDVAVAVAVEGGLFTPIIRDAHEKSLITLSAEMKDLAQRARNKKLAPHEYQGGSFAISNLGMFGVENFDAVINPPHGSILAVGAGVRKPVVNEGGEIKVATVMNVTLSVDHRVIDGALGAQFLVALKNYLESPATMLA